MPAAQHAAGLGRSPAGRRILIVEDELLLAMDYEEMLRREGFLVLGPVGRQASALALLERERPDAAILDVNLAGERSTAVAEALAKRGVPFVVVSGYAERTLSEPVLRGAPRLDKPVQARELVRLIRTLAEPP
jgi:two-component SAPR family response regulator